MSILDFSLKKTVLDLVIKIRLSLNSVENGVRPMFFEVLKLVKIFGEYLCKKQKKLILCMEEIRDGILNLRLEVIIFSISV